jgi:hypothetical protein
VLLRSALSFGTLLVDSEVEIVSKQDKQHLTHQLRRVLMNARATLNINSALLVAAMAMASILSSAPQADAKGGRSVIMQRPSIMADQITSFYVRGGEQNRIMLSMLLGQNFELTTMVRQVTGDQVTPVFLSVSTLPNRHSYFDPMLLSFEQNGKIWKPDPEVGDDMLPLNADGPFGGDVTCGQIHHGVFFVPSWIDTEKPLLVHYGDFKYQARFIAKR